MRWAIGGGSLNKFQNYWFALHLFGPKENWTVELMRIASLTWLGFELYRLLMSQFSDDVLFR